MDFPRLTLKCFVYFSLVSIFSFIWRIYLSIFSTNGFLHKSSLGSTFIRALLSLVSKNRLFIIFLFDLVEWHRYSSHLISVFLNRFHFVALWCITDLHVIAILVSKRHQKTPFKSYRIEYFFLYEYLWLIEIITLFTHTKIWSNCLAWVSTFH